MVSFFRRYTWPVPPFSVADIFLAPDQVNQTCQKIFQSVVRRRNGPAAQHVRARAGPADDGDSAGRPRPFTSTQPNVKANASRPASRNSISKCLSTIGFGCRISEYKRCSTTLPLPALVPERSPDCVVVVDDDGIFNLHLLHGPSDVRQASLEWKLGRVHAKDDEPFPVFLWL